MRLVLVDDSAVARAAFVRIAAAAGCDVVASASDATAGLAYAERFMPDALVVDGRLPMDSAAAFVADLRERCPGVRVFVVVALDEKALVRSMLDAGAVGALLRPVLPSQLVRALGVPCAREVLPPSGEDASPSDFAN